jgi:hypothetical protein
MLAPLLPARFAARNPGVATLTRVFELPSWFAVIGMKTAS